MWRWLLLRRRDRIDPKAAHTFRVTNDGRRVNFAAGGDMRAGGDVSTITVRAGDPHRMRCEVPGCGRLRDDPLHRVDEA